MCNVRVKFVLLISVFLLSETQCKSIKRSQKEAGVSTSNHLQLEETSEISSKNKSSRDFKSSAILAIEIVDPKENSTSFKSKNSKRTASSQLGYGYQPNNYFGVSSKPKLVFYKYSQVGIPPYRGNDYYNNKNQVNVQKSIEYDLGNQQAQYTPQPYLNQQYQPGTTLYTTYNQGNINHLSSQAPRQTGHTNVPVIYLKIYSNQLSNPALYPNLPENHPYSNLNNVNLQTLLSGYNQNAQESYSGQQEQVNVNQGNQDYQQAYVPQNADQNQDYYATQPIEYHQNYQDQISQYQYQQYQQPQQIEQVYNQESSADDLPTHENYPDDAHTRVIFYSDNGGHFPEKAQSLKSNVVPTVTSYTPHKSSVSPAQSYSSLEFRPSQPDYTLSQQQDEHGYYYYKPASTTNYYKQNSVQPYQQTTQIGANLPQVDSHGVEKPYNYHAHPTNTVRRNVRRPTAVPKRIAKSIQED